MKIACFIAYGYLENKVNVDSIIKNLVNHNLDNVEVHVYVGWNDKGNIFSFKKPNFKLGNIVEEYTYNLPPDSLHKVKSIKVKKEPHKGSQKAYYSWHNLISNVDIKYDKYLFFKDTFNETIDLHSILSVDYTLLIYDYYFIDSKGPQKNIWQGIKNKSNGYFNTNDMLICSDTKLMSFSHSGFTKIKAADFFNKGIKKKQFSIIKLFMPDSKVYSLTHNDYINI